MSPGWIPANWSVPDCVVAGTTLRGGGVSEGPFATLNLGAMGDDDPGAVRENRKRFESLCSLPSAPRWLRQVHGVNVVVDPPADDAPEADAAITRHAGVVCAVLTADCLPVILASDDGAEVAVAHAGWRGLAAGVLEATVRTMASAAGDLHAWLGPAISQPEFEVGDEVRDRFVAGNPAADRCFLPNDNGRWQADLYRLARQQLENLGVGHVSGGEHCTFGDSERFFSYRRDGACGRMASFVFRRQ